MIECDDVITSKTCDEQMRRNWNIHNRGGIGIGDRDRIFTSPDLYFALLHNWLNREEFFSAIIVTALDFFSFSTSDVI